MSRRDPPELLVEQLALDELAPADAERVRARLDHERIAGGEDRGGEDRLAELEASNREILADYPAERVAADIRRRLDREAEAASTRSPRRSPLWVLGPALVAAAVIFMLVPREDPQGPVAVADSTGPATLIDDGTPEQTRIKGGVEPHLVIDRQTPTGPERLTSRDGVGAGDLLQLSYVAAGRREGVIVSIDGAGVVTLHHPAEPEGAVRLEPGQEVPLTEAYELDDAPGFERFVFVTRDRGPLGVAEVLEAAERVARDPATADTAALELEGPDWNQHTLVLRKPSSPAPVPAPVPVRVPAPGPAPGPAEAPP